MVIPGFSEKTEKRGKTEIFLAGLRLYEGGSIARVPTGTGDTDLEKLWLFLLKFVGTSTNNQINKIEVFYPGESVDCDCGAVAIEADEEAGTEERLSRACTCRSASAIVHFVDPKAVRVLKSNIKDHKEFHSDGIQTELGVDTVKGKPVVQFCGVCCFLNRRVWVTNQQPTAGENSAEGNGEMQEDDKLTVSDDPTTPPIVTEDQLTAISIILTSVFGMFLARHTATLVEALKGSNLTEMFETVTNGVRDLFSNGDIKSLLPAKLAEEKYKKAISLAVTQIIVNTPSEDCVQKAVTWSGLYEKSETGEVVWPEAPAETEQADLNLSNNGKNDEAENWISNSSYRKLLLHVFQRNLISLK